MALDWKAVKLTQAAVQMQEGAAAQEHLQGQWLMNLVCGVLVAGKQTVETTAQLDLLEQVTVEVVQLEVEVVAKGPLTAGTKDQ